MVNSDLAFLLNIVLPEQFQQLFDATEFERVAELQPEIKEHVTLMCLISLKKKKTLKIEFILSSTHQRTGFMVERKDLLCSILFQTNKKETKTTLCCGREYVTRTPAGSLRSLWDFNRYSNVFYSTIQNFCDGEEQPFQANEIPALFY